MHLIFGWTRLCLDNIEKKKYYMCYFHDQTILAAPKPTYEFRLGKMLLMQINEQEITLNNWIDLLCF